MCVMMYLWGYIMTVAENIKRIRKDKNLTQKQLGEKCGIAESTIRRYELGLLNPKFETIKKIAIALDVETYELDERIGKLRDNYAFIYSLKDTIKELESASSIESSLSENPYIRFIKQYSKWIEDTEMEISQIKTQIGDINTDELFQEEKLLNLYNKLNQEGKQRAIEDIEHLSFIPKYQNSDK